MLGIYSAQWVPGYIQYLPKYLTWIDTYLLSTPHWRISSARNPV